MLFTYSWQWGRPLDGIWPIRGNTFKENSLWVLQSHQLSIAPQVGVGSVKHSLFPIYNDDWLHLVEGFVQGTTGAEGCRSVMAGRHSSLVSSQTSRSYTRSIPLLVTIPEPLGEEWYKYPCMAEHSTHTYLLFALWSVGSFCISHQPHKDTSAMRPESYRNLW